MSPVRGAACSLRAAAAAGRRDPTRRHTVSTTSRDAWRPGIRDATSYPQPEPEDVRKAIELAITLWSAKAKASKFWGDPRPKALNDLTRKLTGKKASAEDAEAFELLSERWHEREISFDPRLIGDWSLEVGDDREPRLSCETKLPDGVEAHVPPPLDKRVAVGGKFLDETQIRTTASFYLRFPVEAHRGAVDEDGTVTATRTLCLGVDRFAISPTPCWPSSGARSGTPPRWPSDRS